MMMTYDVNVFKNLRCRPSTSKRQAGVFRNLHSGDRKRRLRVELNGKEGKK